MSATPSTKAKSLFRVTYRDGSTFTTTAQSSLQAEAKATRHRHGAILKTTFLKDVSK
ncbi:hypothetical protein RMS29_028445 (plasmid) [Agrobacterium rosae]|uniref:Uncharacterized protein n=1 Tax=Agrobacterium rosae TaxID=1972867 RepID=A0ABU4W890_9HYPH|nr:hypothetical protein [Agrobacterium rosae]MDX8332867.1 hypothetical protein [Agrobacterium rosae]